jgi:pyrimidine operon attenuation protein/uracil phosphoribosyltransferase
MSKERTSVLNSIQVEQKFMRMAHEILENNYREKEIVLIGIVGNGSSIAEKLSKILNDIADFNVVTSFIELDKNKPASVEVIFHGDTKSLKAKSIIIIDDVLNSGRTVMYATKYLLDFGPQNIAVAALVERFHRKYPIRADYVGLTLSTNLKEHVAVELIKGKEAVYLE